MGLAQRENPSFRILCETPRGLKKMSFALNFPKDLGGNRDNSGVFSNNLGLDVEREREKMIKFLV